MNAHRAPVDVAAGVLLRPDGRYLLASRPDGKPYASYWEFPGGKVEPGESIANALARELHEELAIDIGTAYPWVVRVYDYPHALVRLHFRRVFAWRGQLQAREHQQFGFFSPHALPDGPLLPATIPVLRLLDLPPIYAITAVAQLGRELFLQRLESALARGLRLLHFREPALDDADAASIFHQVLAQVRAAGATLLINSRHRRTLWDKADGVHLTAADLEMTKRPDVQWLAASTHSVEQIERASALDVDFVVTGPVQLTASHPDRPPLGWTALANTIAATTVPAYALGGMRITDLANAMRHGAHGIASMSAVWEGSQCLNGLTVELDESTLASASFSPSPAME